MLALQIQTLKYPKNLPYQYVDIFGNLSICKMTNEEAWPEVGCTEPIGAIFQVF
jgi:hypothetical protein